MIIPIGYAQVNLVFGGASQPLGAQVTYGVGPGLGAVTPAQVAQVARDLWVTHIRPQMPSSLILTGVKVKKGPNDTGADGGLAFNDAGSVASDPDQPATAFLVQKQTALGGRKQRGRLFHPGVMEARTSAGGVLINPDFTTIVAAFSAWLADMTLANNPMVLFHNDPTLFPTPVSALAVSNKVATQRRRLRR